MSEYEERFAREEKARREYEGDVAYEVWRSGGNPDRIDPDRVDDHWYGGDDPDVAAAMELRHQRPKEQTDE